MQDLHHAQRNEHVEISGFEFDALAQLGSAADSLVKADYGVLGHEGARCNEGLPEGALPASSKSVRLK